MSPRRVSFPFPAFGRTPLRAQRRARGALSSPLGEGDPEGVEGTDTAEISPGQRPLPGFAVTPPKGERERTPMAEFAQRFAPLDAAGADRLSGWLRGYRTVMGIPDELFDASGRPREHWLHFLGDLADYPADQVRNRFTLATRHIRDTGVTYRVYGEENERSWPINPVPLILGHHEWAGIAAAVRQRATLMEALLRDIYGEATLVAQGHLPAAALTGSPDFVR